MSVPSAQLLANLSAELQRHAPFAQMRADHVERFAAAAQLVYYAPDEVVLAPEAGPVRQLLIVRRGHICSTRDGPAGATTFDYVAGDLLPVAALLGRRAVQGRYRAIEDTFCLLVAADDVERLAADSPPFADFLGQRVQQLLALSRRELQLEHASRALAEQSLETRLGQLPRRAPVAVRGDAPLVDALSAMDAAHVGSVLVLDADGRAEGILTRYDLLGRVLLPRVPLDAPVACVASAPVLQLDVAATAQDAALLMARHGVRHVPITEHGKVVGVVSERDLFAMQRLSLSQVGGAIRGAPDVPALIAVAPGIGRLAVGLLGQGVSARRLTELVSGLADRLNERLVQLVGAAHGVDLRRACWLAFGSQGRGEQTIASDQDNGLAFDGDAADRPAWLAFAHDVNDALDACGYPLCRGGIMASNPECCLTADEWRARFDHWIDHGAPQDLLAASIFFDLRAIAGRAELAQPLTAHLVERAPRVPRFLKQLAENALQNRPPLAWHGGLETVREADWRDVVDLKLHGAMPFTDAARILALARGVDATGTRARFEALAASGALAPADADAAAGAFEFVQSLRLRVQSERSAVGNPNLIEPARLNDIDRRVLKEALRVAQRLQQRLELDYRR
jgi:CBS domain-containing protein